VHLVGFVIRIYRDTLSHERPIYPCTHCIYCLCNKSVQNKLLHITIRYDTVKKQQCSKGCLSNNIICVGRLELKGLGYKSVNRVVLW
jgi:hypothetical protein